MVSPKVEKILDAVLAHAEKVIDIDCFYIALYNKVTVKLDFPLAVRKVGASLERLEAGKGRWASRPYEPSEYLPDCIFAEGQPVLIEENFEAWIAGKEVVYQADDERRPLSWLGVPLVARGRVVGVVVVEDYEHEHAYDARTLTILSAMANRTAGALANANLIESLRAVNQVGQELTSGIRLSVDEILDLIYQQASQLMDTRDMYVALYDAGQQALSFPLAMYDGEREEWPSRPVEIEDETKGGLTEEVIRAEKPFCPLDVEAWYTERNIEPAVKPVPRSWLGVPMTVEDRVLGVIALQNDEVENLYGPDDLEVLQTMAGQAAAALKNASLVESLRVVNQVGQVFTSDIRLSVDEILDLIYQQASRLMDTRDMYIALYNEGQQALSFPLAMYDGEREEWPSRPVEIEDETKGGLTEEVIRAEKPFCPLDVEAWYTERNIEPAVKPVPRSWLGVPMGVGDRVLGVVALQNDEVENLYGPDDLEVLQTMAGQAAIAIDNARMRHAQEQEAAEQKWAALGRVSAGVAHRLGNKAGVVRVKVKELYNMVPRDEATIGNLETIERNNRYLLELAELLLKPVKAASQVLEPLDINIVLRDARKKADIPSGIKVKMDLAKDLPEVFANHWFLEVFVELITNAVWAMEKSPKKILGICSRRANNNWVEVLVKDTGCGIPPALREKIFELFFFVAEREEREKIPGKHQGFGLWWIKAFLTDVGAQLELLESELDKGTTFVVRLPSVVGQ